MMFERPESGLVGETQDGGKKVATTRDRYARRPREQRPRQACPILPRISVQ